MQFDEEAARLVLVGKPSMRANSPTLSGAVNTGPLTVWH
jgi:hypothetical protein